MAKGVLGNDPFQRGAAPRSPAIAPAAPAPPEAPPAAPEPAQAKAPPAAKPRKKPLPAVKPPPGPRLPRPEARVASEPQAPASSAPAALATTPPEFGARASGALGALRSILSQALHSGSIRQALTAASGSYHAVMTGLGAGGNVPLDDYGQDLALVGQLSPIAEFLYERYWRIQVDGADRIPRGPVVLVANHSGALPYDGPVTKYALGRERPDLAAARWLVEDQIFYAPFMGTLLNRLGAVRANPENALRLLSEERPVIVFPEGVQGMSKNMRERYRLKRFGRGGFVKIALRSGAPILPVAIVGAEEATPLLAKLPGKLLGLPYLPVTPLGPIPLPSRWRIRFGDPIDLSGHTPEAAEDLTLIQRTTERTREAIQGMLESLLKERKSAFS